MLCCASFPRPYGVGDTLLSLATYSPRLAPRIPKNLPHGRVFPAVGLATLHTALGDGEKDITFLLRSSSFGSVSHGHADQNAFVIEAFGRGLALATGYYPWYGSPHHHRWTRSTRSVNSILVDDEGQIVRSRDACGRLTAFKLGGGYDYIEAEAGAAYGDRLRRFRRHVVHARPGTFVIYDALEATRPATFQCLLHAHDRFEIDGNVLTTRRDPARLRVHILLPKDPRIFQTHQYDPEPEEQPLRRLNWEKTWHLQAESVVKDRDADFLTVLTIRHTGDSTGEEMQPKVALLEGKGAVGVRLIWPDWWYPEARR